MATSTRLNEGWTLTDGVFAPFLLDKPRRVPDALRAQGLLEKSPVGAQFLHEEWMYLRTFSYRARFVLPEDAGDVASLLFTALLGEGFILLNGEILWEFSGGQACFPINSHLQAGENELEVRFIPPLKREPFGIEGEVFLRTGCDLLVDSARFSGLGDTVETRIALECFVSGKYLFKYTLAREGAFPEQYEFIERLRALSAHSLRHALPVKDPVPWDGARPEQTGYVLRLSIERMGLCCEQIDAQLALVPEGGPPTRIARLAPGVDAEFALPMLQTLGVQAVLAPEQRDRNALLLPSHLRHGLLVLEETDAQLLPMDAAALEERDLLALAGDMTAWPSNSPLWKLLNAPEIGEAPMEALFGVNATGNAKRCLRLTRALQAERLFSAACERRRLGQAALIDDPIEAQPSPASHALVECSGKPRTAFDALRAAWQRALAYVRLPEPFAAPCGQSASFPVFLLLDGAQEPVSVSIECRTLDGALLSASTFTALGSSSDPIGELPLTLPEVACVMALHATVTGSRGDRLFVHEQLLCAQAPDGAPLGALMSVESYFR